MQWRNINYYEFRLYSVQIDYKIYNWQHFYELKLSLQCMINE